MPTSRRCMIRSLAAGGLLLPGMLQEMLAGESSGSKVGNSLAAKAPHFAPRAKRVIFLFMTGGVSHVDTFDHKPILNARHNQKHTNGDVLKGADWKFSRYGECGMEVSDLFPEIGSVSDEISLIRSMKGDNGDHFGATIGIHTGSTTFNRPSIGSWVSYGLGTENRNLPSFMVISQGLPYAGGQVWGSDFLPVVHQGTRIVPGKEPIANMRRRSISSDLQQTELDMLGYFNRQHLVGREVDSNLASRIASYETAFGMQTEAPEIFDLRKESRKTLESYGVGIEPTHDFGRRCLMARRLVENGVRFTCVVSGGGPGAMQWDAHKNISHDHASGYPSKTTKKAASAARSKVKKAHSTLKKA